MSSYCSNCGASAAGASFCPACGSAVQGNNVNSSFGQPQGSNLGTPQSFSVAMWSHLSTLLTGLLAFFCILPGFLTWLPPLIIRNKFRHDNFVYRHATASLNFQLQWLILALPMLVLVFFTFGLAAFLVIGAALFQVIVVIMASVAAYKGAPFSYPLQFINLVK